MLTMALGGCCIFEQYYRVHALSVFHIITPRRIVGFIALCAAGLAASLTHQMVSVSARPVGPPTSVMQKSPSIGVLVASVDVPAGAVLSTDELQWQQWPADLAGSQFILQSNNARAKAEFTGAVARTPLVRGEPITDGKVSRASNSGLLATMLPAGVRAITVNVTAESGVGGFIQPNDHVDVVMTAPDKLESEETYDSKTIVANVPVIAVDGRLGGSAAKLAAPARTATLAVTPEQAEQITTARRIGSLSLLLRSAVDQQAASAPPGCELRVGQRDSVAVFRSGKMTQQVFIRPSCGG
jgi:pilus assembly protein CpaB